jgi:hypothetical protein
LLAHQFSGRLPALPFAQYGTGCAAGVPCVCGIGGTGNKFCAPLPAGASTCDHNGAVQSCNCVGSTCSTTPKPTPKPPAPTPKPPAPVPAPTPGGDPGCLARVNFHRKNHGLYPMTAHGAAANACATKQAQVDAKNFPVSAHSMFGECGESGQCEAAGVATCPQAIDEYYAEGPTGGHYQIIMSTAFKTMSWGGCLNCVPKYGYMYTPDFWR